MNKSKIIEKQLCLFCKKPVSEKDIKATGLYAHEKCWHEALDLALQELKCTCPQGCRSCAIKESKLD